MGLIHKLEAAIVDALGENIPANTDSKDIFMLMIEGARKEIWIVAGELDPTFYCGKFISAIKQKMDDIPVFKVNIIFHKDEDRVNVIQKLKEENKSLIDLFLNEKYNKNIALYWANKRPRYHFVVANNSVLLEQKDHPPNEYRDVYINKNNPTLAQKYKEYFYSMTRKTEIVKKLKKSEFTNA